MSTTKNSHSRAMKPLYITEDEFIKNPYTMVNALGQFSLVQTNIVMTLISTLQFKIDELLSQPKIPGRQLSLFDDEEFLGDKLQIAIPLNSLGINARDYSDLENACNKMSNVLVQAVKYDHQGQRYKAPVQMMKCWIPDREATSKGGTYKFAKGTRRTGQLIIEIERPVAETYFTLKQGYTKQLHKLNRQCRCSKTFPLYSWLSRFKAKDMGNGQCTEDPIKLKEILGIITINKSTRAIIHDTYPRWSKFMEKALNPALVELKKLFEEGRSDFYAEYTPEYARGKKTGTPDKVHFTLIFTNEGQYTEIKDEETTDMYLYSGLTDYELLKELAAKGNEWAQQCLDGKVKNDAEYVETLRKLTEDR